MSPEEIEETGSPAMGEPDAEEAPSPAEKAPSPAEEAPSPAATTDDAPPESEAPAKPARRRRRAKTEAEAEPAAETGTAGEHEPEPVAEPVAAAAAEPEAEVAAQPAKPAEPSKPAKPAPARRRAAREPGAAPPVVRAQAKFVRSSPRKARLVCDHIRGKTVEEARAILAHTPRAVARDWSKLLESAVANAEHNHELVGEDLYVKAVTADDGPTIKRFRPRAMGRATKIRKRTTHLTILLTPKD
jgi:ribosomal protein L22